MSSILTYEDAYEIIREQFKQIKPSIIEVEILDSLNHLLAEDIISDIDMPPFDYSAMDGYAVKYNDNIKEWNVIGEISTNSSPVANKPILRGV